MRAASLAELARHRLIEIAAGERLGRSSHIAEALRRHQHEHVRRAAADILALAAMALRLEPRLAFGHVADFSAIASALQCHRSSSKVARFAASVTYRKLALSPLARHRPHRLGRRDGEKKLSTPIATIQKKCYTYADRPKRVERVAGRGKTGVSQTFLTTWDTS